MEHSSKGASHIASPQVSVVTLVLPLLLMSLVLVSAAIGWIIRKRWQRRLPIDDEDGDETQSFAVNNLSYSIVDKLHVHSKDPRETGIIAGSHNENVRAGKTGSNDNSNCKIGLSTTHTLLREKGHRKPSLPHQKSDFDQRNFMVGLSSDVLETESTDRKAPARVFDNDFPIINDSRNEEILRGPTREVARNQSNDEIASTKDPGTVVSVDYDQTSGSPDYRFEARAGVIPDSSLLLNDSLHRQKKSRRVVQKKRIKIVK